MAPAQTYAYVTPIFSLTNGSDQKTILIDSSFSFRCDTITAYATSSNARVMIEYNGDLKLTNDAAYLDTIANVNNKGEIKINPFNINPNSTIRVTVTNDSGAANTVQLAFVGMRS